MTTDTKYNGWTNYETWNVALWLDNEQGTHDLWLEQAKECWDDAKDTPSANFRLTGREPFTHEERAAFTLADRLKDSFEEDMPDLGVSCWADLLNAALSEVDWLEIAKSLIESVDKTEEPEEVEAE